MEQMTAFVPVDIILPKIDSERDQCIVRLRELLESKPKVLKVHVIQKALVTGFCVHYDPDTITLDRLKALAKLAGSDIEKRYQHKILQVQGMDSPDCAAIIENDLAKIPGILAARVSYASQKLRLEFDSKKISLNKITKRLKRLGYLATLKEEKPNWMHRQGELLLSIAAGVLLLASWLIGEFSALPNAVSLSFALAAYAAGGILTLRDSIQTLLQKRFDIDVLMLLAAVGAAILGAWQEGALLLFLFSLGHALEHKALNRARNAVNAMAKLTPKIALVERDGEQIEMLIEEVLRDDVVIVKPGQRIPADGVIESGASGVDQAPITGESIPVDKQPGDSVFAGTVNGEGTLMVKVTKLAEDSTLSRMMRMVLEADTQKSPTQRFTIRFVRYFVPVVLIGVALLIILPPLFGAVWASSFYRAISVLVAASPCALAIATPSAVLSGVARAAQNGVLIKGGMHLENLGTVRAIAFDKTGTLTMGQPEVQEIIPIDGDEKQLLSMAASLERLSAHPLAQAVVTAAMQRELPLHEVSDSQSITGFGIRATLKGQLLVIGRLKLFENYDVPSQLKQQVAQLQEQGHTVMVVRYGEKWLGIIGLADSIREEAPRTIQALYQQGITKTIMLTGDNVRVANNIAKQVHITEVRAELLPEDKLAAISELEKENQSIAMVGDGVNDAPALARSTVGIAMGAAGTDVALEAADVALMANDISKLPFAVSLSRASQRIIRQNLMASLGVVGILIIATLTGVIGIGIAVLVHEGSTLLVVANALRLLRHDNTNGGFADTAISGD